MHEPSLAPRARLGVPPAPPPTEAAGPGVAPSNAEVQAHLVAQGLLASAPPSLPPAPALDTEPWLAGLRGQGSRRS